MCNEKRMNENKSANFSVYDAVATRIVTVLVLVTFEQKDSRTAHPAIKM
jgi:hypothetical protein